MDLEKKISDLEIIKEEPKIKKGVDFVFEQHSELEKIGSKEEYSRYLDSIFPESKVRDIVYHGGLEERTSWRNNQHFGTKGAALHRAEFIKQVRARLDLKPFLYPVLLNIINIKRVEDADYVWESVVNEAEKEKYNGLVYINNQEDKNVDSYVVFDPENIHILGSEKDLENFKKFVESKKQNQEEKYLV